MVILGAGGFAKELIDVLITDYKYTNENLFFFDEINKTRKSLSGFKILHSTKEVEKVFKEVSNEFCLGVGSPKARYDLCNRFEHLGGKPATIISLSSHTGRLSVKIGEGSVIMGNCTISNGAVIGKGSLINVGVIVAHDATIGKYVEISPVVTISGNCKIGNYVTIGTGAVILPKVKIGDNSFIAAGSVVANDIPANSMVVGIVPSRVVQKLPPFEE